MLKIVLVNIYSYPLKSLIKSFFKLNFCIIPYTINSHRNLFCKTTLLYRISTLNRLKYFSLTIDFNNKGLIFILFLHPGIVGSLSYSCKNAFARNGLYSRGNGFKQVNYYIVAQQLYHLKNTELGKGNAWKEKKA